MSAAKRCASPPGGDDSPGAKKQKAACAAATSPEGRDPELVAIIIAAKDAEMFLPECLASVAAQTYAGGMEVSVYLDGCASDASLRVVEAWAEEAEDRFRVVVGSGPAPGLGAGPARNRAILQSSAPYLCILDADDVMEPGRVAAQLAALQKRPQAIVGARFSRIPADATARYTRWCNELTQEQLMLQRFRELTVVQPTWFLARDTWERAGRYPESNRLDGLEEAQLTEQERKVLEGPVLAEDLRLFYKHLEVCERDGVREPLYVVEGASLLRYRHSSGSASWRTPRRLLFRIKARALERAVLRHWDGFTIWGAGRDGKDLFKMLGKESASKVRGFCDVDPNKIRNGYHNRVTGVKLPVIHFSEAKPPLVLCVALDRGGEFERNLASLGLREGRDYVHFS